jgi:hypothetical protein
MNIITTVNSVIRISVEKLSLVIVICVLLVMLIYRLLYWQYANATRFWLFWELASVYDYPLSCWIHSADRPIS